MSMLCANDPRFRELYPNWANVYDARGRRLLDVMACDAATGEVVMYDPRPDPWDRLFHYLTPSRRARWWRLRSRLPTRHGFWPAPLRIVPKDPQS
jgi:hypothetical protein